MTLSEFTGLTAVVTGGSSGIGFAIAEALDQAGANVHVFDLTESPSPTVTSHTVNVSDDDSVRAAVTNVLLSAGQLDIVINNAGIGAQGTIEMNSDEEWHRVFDVNVMGAVRVTRAALPALRRSSAAAVVNTCSIAATAGLPERVLYSSTKGALLALTRAAAADHVREGIRFNAVNPGTADTPWVGRLLNAAGNPEEERSALEKRQPHGRLVQAEEIARAVLYLASPHSGSTTGTSLEVDGGMSGLRLRLID